jgi:uncharacterized phage protein (TIGR01671 family)
MGREIKFRAKRIDNGEWVYGDYYRASNTHNIVVNHSDNENDFDNHEVTSDSIGQFTELRDKNGVDIYEGDILQGFSDFPSCYEVFYDNGSFRLRYKMKEDTYYDWGYLHRIFEIKDMYAEVIGNIHEHLNLLK